MVDILTPKLFVPQSLVFFDRLILLLTGLPVSANYLQTLPPLLSLCYAHFSITVKE